MNIIAKNLGENPANNGLRYSTGKMESILTDSKRIKSTDSRIRNLGFEGRPYGIRKNIKKVNMRNLIDILAITDDDGDGSPDDTRIHISRNNFWPYTAIGQLKILFPNDKVLIGTGSVVNRHHVLTAAHNLHDKEKGGWAKRIQFSAALNGAVLNFKTALAVDLMVSKKWFEQESPSFDIGVVSLNSDIGLKTGWLGMLAYKSRSRNKNKKISIAGYPYTEKAPGLCIKCGDRLLVGTGKISRVNEKKELIYKIDTERGQSGSSLRDSLSEQILGVHTFGRTEDNFNRGVPLTHKILDSIVKWVNRT